LAYIFSRSGKVRATVATFNSAVRARELVSIAGHYLVSDQIPPEHRIIIGNMTIAASIGFGESRTPQEIFLSGAKDGSGMAAILEDASVVISVALPQNG
jgi:hypothetical protein